MTRSSAVRFGVLLLVVSAALWATANAVAPKDPTWDDVLAEARSGGYRLIDTARARQLQLESPHHLLLVDTRQEWEYGAGHIQGAVNFPMEPTWWARRHKSAALERFLGPDRDRAIVFY